MIQGPDIEQLQTYVLRLMEKMREIPGVADVATNYEPTQQELRILVDRPRAAPTVTTAD